MICVKDALAPEHKRVLFIGVLVLGILVLLFAWVPLPGGDDWAVFYVAARRVLEGSALYGEPLVRLSLYDYYYYNPPWLAVSLIPLALLPFRWGRAVLSASTLLLAALLLRRWEKSPYGLPKMVLVLLSPPMIYLLRNGQVDALVLGGVFLPVEFWPLVALTKPQVAVGLALGVPRPHWRRAALVMAGFLLLSGLFWGNWLVALVQQPAPLANESNLWFGMWPFQVPVGLALLWLGIRDKDERLLVASSPFLSPYASTHSLLGPWIALLTWLSPAPGTIALLTWWSAIIYRLNLF